MFPDVTFLHITLYEWCLIVGILLALVSARVLADGRRAPAKLQTLSFLVAYAAIAGGYGFAVLFQGFYNFVDTGVFTLGRNTGATFYGGLIGGAAIFFLGYFGLGRIFLKDIPVKYLKTATDCGACAIAIAHCVGRLGCTFAGCCYGKPTDSWIGVYFPAVGAKVVPTQLIECIFLLLLFAVLLFVFFKTRISCMGVYLTAYAVFRFIIEFWRDDPRGSLGVSLSPSQVVAIVLFVLGIATLVLFGISERKKRQTAGFSRESKNA